MQALARHRRAGARFLRLSYLGQTQSSTTQAIHGMGLFSEKVQGQPGGTMSLKQN